MYKLLKKPFFGQYMVKWRNPLTEQEQKEWETMEVKSKSGATIKGLFAKSAHQPAKATIVLGHPMGKEAKAFFLKNGYSDLLRKNGYNVVVFDINGFGESSHGNFSYFEDIIAISIKAKSLTPELPLGYHGISLGGQWATIAFTDAAHQYNFAIVESAATSLDEFWINFKIANRVLKVLNFLLPKYAKQVKMVERIKEVKNLKSILFIYSYADNWTPVEMGERFAKSSNVPAELWTVENATHAQIMKSAHKVAYENKILSYFDESIS